METDIAQALKQFDEKLTAIQVAVDKTRRYLWWGLVLQLGMVLVPLLLIMLALPWIMSAVTEALGGELL